LDAVTEVLNQRLAAEFGADGAGRATKWSKCFRREGEADSKQLKML
jgi:hypothetical protein